MKIVIAAGRAFDLDHPEVIVSQRGGVPLLRLQPIDGDPAMAHQRAQPMLLKQLDGSEVPAQTATAIVHRAPAEFAPVEALHFAPWSAGQVYYGGQGEAVWAPSVGDSRDQLAALIQHHRIEPKPFASIAWGETFQDVVVVTWRVAQTAIEDAVVSDSVGTLSDRVDTVLPGFKARYGVRTAAKAELVTQLNPLDSLAALEQQLDLLTEVVLAMPKAEMPAQLQPVLVRLEQILASHGAHRGRGLGQALDAIESHKAGLRQRQARYFRRREGR